VFFRKLHASFKRGGARSSTIERAATEPRGIRKKIERPNMTEGDVIEFTLRDQRHTAVVMLMTDDDIVLLDLVDGDRPAWAGISTLQDVAVFSPEPGEVLVAA
jgi:hypothetical protein